MKKTVIAPMLMLAANMGATDAMAADNNQIKGRNMEELKLTDSWDKTFPQSAKMQHSKVTFVNRYGITLAADM